MMKALVIGATGLSGKATINQLILDERFTEVVAFSRRPIAIIHQKFKNEVVDFNSIEEWSHLLTGDILFSVLGTTKKDAGSTTQQYLVDYTYQYECAYHAAQHKVHTLCLVSSVGANPRSPIFYSRIKGELEEAVLKLQFSTIRILRPGPITGQRERKRLMENISVSIIRFLNSIGLFKKYRPAEGLDIANALINAAFDSPKLREKTYELNQVFTIANKQ